MIGFIVDVEFVWGFQSKIVGYSKTSPSFTYPPPTTILGAIAENIAKEKNLGEGKGKDVITKLSNNLIAIGVRPLNCLSIKFSDINRLISIRRTGKRDYPSAEDPYGSFDAPAMGKTILAPLVDESPKLRYFIVFKDEYLHRIGATDVFIDSDSIWGIHRLGSKESIVSVSDVEECEPQKMVGQVNTYYSFPLIEGVTAISPIVRKWSQENLINPFNLLEYNPINQYLLGQSIVRFYLPVMEAPKNYPIYAIKVSGNACAYMHGEEVIVGHCLAK